MPQIDQIHTFPSQLFWLAFAFILLYVLVSGSILPRIHDVLERRSQRIRQDLDRAEALSHDAEEARQAYERLERDARIKSQEVLAEATARVKAAQEARMAELSVSIEQKMQQSRQRLSDQRAVVVGQMQQVSEEITKNILAKVSDVHLDDAIVAQAVHTHMAH